VNFSNDPKVNSLFSCQSPGSLLDIQRGVHRLHNDGHCSRERSFPRQPSLLWGTASASSTKSTATAIHTTAIIPGIRCRGRNLSRLSFKRLLSEGVHTENLYNEQSISYSKRRDGPSSTNQIDQIRTEFSRTGPCFRIPPVSERRMIIFHRIHSLSALRHCKDILTNGSKNDERRLRYYT
jgi:hypothetical protein